MTEDIKRFADIVLRKAVEAYENVPLSDEIGSVVQKYVMTEVAGFIYDALAELEEEE